jgi:hypothetical protein
MAKSIRADTQYCSCIEFESKKTKGTPKVYQIKRGKKCSDVLNRQAHINSWCCLFKRWQDYIGNNIVKNDIQLFSMMASDPDSYYQKVYPWGDYGWFGPFDNEDEALKAANKQIEENYNVWDVLWKTTIKKSEGVYEPRSIFGIIGGFNIHGHTLNRDGNICAAITYSSSKTVKNIVDKDGRLVDLWIWEVDGDNNLGLCGLNNSYSNSSRIDCYSFTEINNFEEFCNNNDYDKTIENVNTGCWCCGNYTGLNSKYDLITNNGQFDIGPCGNPYQSDKRNGRFKKYDKSTGALP